MINRRQFFGGLGAAAVVPLLPKLPLSSSTPVEHVVPAAPALQPAEYTWSEVAPAFSFCNDTDTGIYRVAADQIGICVGGQDVGIRIRDREQCGEMGEGTWVPDAEGEIPRKWVA